MLRQLVRAALVLGLLCLLSASARVNGEEDKPDPAAAEKKAQGALAKLDKGWKPYDNKPNLDDPRWKVEMEALVQVVRAGSAAVPVLQAAAKKGSSWSDSTRAFADKVLKVVEGPAAIRNAIAEYDLAEMDTARVGKPAPDFALPDAGGESYRLSQFRGKKVVVLTFVVADT
jgi:AhpC/TSA family